MPPGCPPRPASLRLFFALLAVVYLTVFPYFQPLNNPNENTRVYLTVALVDHGTFRLDEVVRRHGWTNDMARVPDPDGSSHYAAAKGPLVAYLGVPVYAAQRGVARLLHLGPPAADAPAAAAASWLRATTLTLQLFCVHLPCLLFLLWFERRLRRWAPDLSLRLSAVVAVGLGSNFLAYSFLFASHALCAVASFVALDFIAACRLRARGDPGRARPAHALAAGLLAGLPALLEYQNASLSLILGLYGLSLFRRRRTLPALAAGALIDVLLLALFQWRSFGAPWKTGVLFMENPAFRAVWQQGFLGFTLPRPEALSALLFDGAFGLFSTSPWLLLGLAGAALAPLLLRTPGPARRERRLELLVAAAMIVALTLLMSGNISWRGGWTIGPRYLGALPPLLALPAVALLSSLARSPRAREPLRAAAAALALASFARAGAVALFTSTLPESIERPLLQIVLPWLRLRLFPHHAAELLGARSPAFWLATAACAVAAASFPLVAAAAPAPHRALRAVAALALAGVLLVPALRLPAGKPDDGPAVRAFFYSIWEPAGLDLLARARAAAASDACAEREVARLERLLGRPREAEGAERRGAACGFLGGGGGRRRWPQGRLGRRHCLQGRQAVAPGHRQGGS